MISFRIVAVAIRVIRTIIEGCIGGFFNYHKISRSLKIDPLYQSFMHPQTLFRRCSKLVFQPECIFVLIQGTFNISL